METAQATRKSPEQKDLRVCGAESTREWMTAGSTVGRLGVAGVGAHHRSTTTTAAPSWRLELQRVVKKRIDRVFRRCSSSLKDWVFPNELDGTTTTSHELTKQDGGETGLRYGYALATV